MKRWVVESRCMGHIEVFQRCRTGLGARRLASAMNKLAARHAYPRVEYAVRRRRVTS